MACRAKIQRLWDNYKFSKIYFALLNQMTGRNVTIDFGQEVIDRLIDGTASSRLEVRLSSVSDAAILAKHLADNTSVQYLYIIGRKLGDNGIRFLCNALHLNRHLRLLGLIGHEIGVQGAKSISVALCNNPALENLVLTGNALGDSGARGLSSILSSPLCVLRQLHLGQNLIGDDGCVALADALHLNASLEGLRLKLNSITNVGALAIAASVKTHQRLILLDLSCNSISDEGARALLTTLRASSRVIACYLLENAVSDDLIDEFEILNLRKST